MLERKPLSSKWLEARKRPRSTTLLASPLLTLFLQHLLFVSIRAMSQSWVDLWSAPEWLLSCFSLTHILWSDFKHITSYFWTPTSSVYICIECQVEKMNSALLVHYLNGQDFSITRTQPKCRKPVWWCLFQIYQLSGPQEYPSFQEPYHQVKCSYCK